MINIRYGRLINIGIAKNRTFFFPIIGIGLGKNNPFPGVIDTTEICHKHCIVNLYANN